MREDVARALERRFPGLAVRPLHELATGFGSEVVETADGVVFRIARHRGVADGHARELRALPVLAPRLPAAAPRPEFRVEPGESDLPYGAIGYRRLPGEPAMPATAGKRLAGDLARFLRAVHDVPLSEAEALGLEAWLPPAEGFARQRDQVLPALRDALSREEYAVVAEWWDRFLADEELLRFTPALKHSDPWYGNVLVDPATGALAAVLDWEGLEVGDPAWDAAAQLEVGDAFFEAFVASYHPADPRFVYRARRIYEQRVFGGVRLSLAVGDDAELADAVEKVRRSSILR